MCRRVKVRQKGWRAPPGGKDADMQARSVGVAVERRSGRERRDLVSRPSRRWQTRLAAPCAESWGRLLRETWRSYVNEILLGVLGTVVLALLLATYILDARWRSQNCITALKEPAANPAVLMAVCR
jgi:hypothetical protein